MRREIFGPILPIVTYGELEEVVEAINAGDRPLALYPFTRNAATRRLLIAHTRSGGVSVNDTILHVVQHDLPFGGVGPSGMGHYHGREGFETFSKLRPVFQEGFLSPVQAFMQPPYTRFSRLIVDFMLWMKSSIPFSRKAGRRWRGEAAPDEGLRQTPRLRGPAPYPSPLPASPRPGEAGGRRASSLSDLSFGPLISLVFF